MTRRIALALVLHNHQPVGNFGWVLADVCERAYEPMVAALERHPAVRVALHYSGPLLEWLIAERPELLARLRALQDRGQVEILGGALQEPVLAALPERDRVGQLVRMREAVTETFGRTPPGAWLAERVWEPDIPTSLVDAGYRWTVLDDAHLRAATVPEDEMWGPYTTDDQGRLLTVFATEQGLRYRIPFQPVEDVIAYLRDHATEAGERVGTMGDDGEKFGSWPGTWEHCWGETRWVERFFEALEANASWLTTTTPSAWLAEHAPVGRVSIPVSSYAEMGEWALPADEARAYGVALKHARETGAPEARWLRGASWRNFQVKYREVNDLHKQMLRVSDKVASMPAGPDRDAALDHLYRGQSNDCYWHGLFGGIYITHMRAATLAELIAAEDIADRVLARTSVSERRDLDLDGRDEVLLASPGQVVTVDVDEGGGIASWDVRAACHPLTSVLRRRPEAYHALLRASEPTAAAPPADGAGSEKASSIHEVVRVKEPGLAELLRYDDYERRSGLVRFLASSTTPDAWSAGGRDELGDFVDAPFEIDRLEGSWLDAHRDGMVRVGSVAIPVRVTRRLALSGGRDDPGLELEVRAENLGATGLEARLGVEWALLLLGGGANPQAWWDVAGERTPHDGRGAASGVSVLAQGNDWLGLVVSTHLDVPASAWWAPIETVSNSEDGFERTYQGSALLLSWRISLAPGASLSRTVRHRLRVGPATSLASPSDGMAAEGASVRR